MKIGIMGAMDEEIQMLKEEIAVTRVVDKAGMTFYEGSWERQQVVLVQSGIGKVNAALCSQILIDTFGVEVIVFTGVAGGLHPQLNIGDLVISRDTVQHDFDVRDLGYPLGEIPRLNRRFFEADPGLVQLGVEAGATLKGVNVMVGRVLSGDQFIASKEKAAVLREELEGDCTEMEGAAVAQVCSLYGIPFVIIRSMSDRADGSAPDNFHNFVMEAAENSLRLIRQMVRNIR